MFLIYVIYLNLQVMGPVDEAVAEGEGQLFIKDFTNINFVRLHHHDQLFCSF